MQVGRGCGLWAVALRGSAADPQEDTAPPRLPTHTSAHAPVGYTSGADGCRPCNESSVGALRAVADCLQPDCLEVRSTLWRAVACCAAPRCVALSTRHHCCTMQGCYTSVEHQLNATFFSAVGEDPKQYLLARCGEGVRGCCLCLGLSAPGSTWPPADSLSTCRCSRAVQLFTPGVPMVYYVVSLLTCWVALGSIRQWGRTCTN
jgi:hypothetical protein